MSAARHLLVDLDEEPAKILTEMLAMSRENSTDTLADANGIAMPWWDALMLPVNRVFRTSSYGRLIAQALFKRLTGATEDELRKLSHTEPRGTLPVYDGKRPESVTDAMMVVRRWERTYTTRTQSEDFHALVQREYDFDLGDHDDTPAVGVRETHRRHVHRALAGETYDQRYDRLKAEGGVIRELAPLESTNGPTIPGCRWCRKAGER